MCSPGPALLKNITESEVGAWSVAKNHQWNSRSRIWNWHWNRSWHWIEVYIEVEVDIRTWVLISQQKTLYEACNAGPWSGLGGLLGALGHFLSALGPLLEPSWPVQVAKKPLEGNPKGSKIDFQKHLTLKTRILQKVSLGLSTSIKQRCSLRHLGRWKWTKCRLKETQKAPKSTSRGIWHSKHELIKK